MTQPEACPNHGGNSLDSHAPIAIDPVCFFQYASTSAARWRELIGLTINHCTYGLGTIRKIEGDYLYVDLPERQGKKHLTEFGLDSFQRGFFNNLQIDDTLQQKITAAAAACLEMSPESDSLEAEAPKEPAKKREKALRRPKRLKGIRKPFSSRGVISSRQNRPGEVMSKRLSIDKLPHYITEEQLETLFSEAGAVILTKIIPYVHNGKPCGFGLVEMATQEAGRKAISILDGRNLDGHLLAVKAEYSQSKKHFGIPSRKGR